MAFHGAIQMPVDAIALSIACAVERSVDVDATFACPVVEELRRRRPASS